MVLRCVVSLVLHMSGVLAASQGQLDNVQLCAIGLTRQVRFFSLVMPTGRLVTPASGRGVAGSHSSAQQGGCAQQSGRLFRLQQEAFLHAHPPLDLSS